MKFDLSKLYDHFEGYEKVVIDSIEMDDLDNMKIYGKIYLCIGNNEKPILDGKFTYDYFWNEFWITQN